jgi:glutamate-1-semialdehyde 2,1-aminomutase
MPSLEKVRLVNSGTEATLSAVRLARGFTGRDVVVKFAGHYHGHHDSLLVASGSGGATFSVPDSAGVPRALAALTRVLPFNSPDAVRRLFAKEGDDIAAVIVEPIAGNMGVVPPAEGFLALLREESRRAGALLGFDEVMTGFRVALGGAQALYGVTPDLTTLGKIIGGGFPLAAYGGRGDVMDRVSPVGPVYQAGTLSGNPVAVAAGLAQLESLFSDPGVYARLEVDGARVESGLLDAARANGVPLAVNRVGSMMTPFFLPARGERVPVTDFESARACDASAYAVFFRRLLDRGVYLPPSAFESLFLSTAHSEAELDLFLAAARESFSIPLEAAPGAP